MSGLKLPLIQTSVPVMVDSSAPKRGAKLSRSNAQLRKGDNASTTPPPAERMQGGRIKNFFKGAKMAVAGGAQTAAWMQAGKAGLIDQEGKDDKISKTGVKALDGWNLMKSAFQGTKVDAKTYRSIATREQKNANKAEAKAADKQARKDAAAARRAAFADKMDNY